MRGDVIIIGAGHAGLGLANSLSELGLTCFVVDRKNESYLSSPSYDGREFAITHCSRQLLKKMGAWNRMPEKSVGFIKEAKVLDGDSDYSLHFDHRSVCDSTLGYIASASVIAGALYDEAKSRSNVSFFYEDSIDKINTSEGFASVTLSSGKKLCCSLVVAADGRASKSRSLAGISASIHDFGRSVIVSRFKHDLPHEDIAYECFGYGSTLAMLPLLGQESSAVITISSDKVQDILSMTGTDFSIYVENAFKSRFGNMSLVSERFSYPLVVHCASKFYSRRFALLGDAAIAIHPVTAHGFNLGMMGQHMLFKNIRQSMKYGGDIGSHKVLSSYNSDYRLASIPLYIATNLIVDLYTGEHPVQKIARKSVLRVGNYCTPAKKAIIKHITDMKDVVFE